MHLSLLLVPEKTARRKPPLQTGDKNVEVTGHRGPAMHDLDEKIAKDPADDQNPG